MQFFKKLGFFKLDQNWFDPPKMVLSQYLMIFFKWLRVRFCVAKMYGLRLCNIGNLNSKIDFQVVEEPIVPTPPPAFDSNDILRALDEGGIEFINLTEKMVTSSSHVFTNSESTNTYIEFFHEILFVHAGIQSVFFCLW